MKRTSIHRAHGFTLVEIAIALLIISIMISGVLGSTRIFLEQRDAQQTSQQLEQIVEALYGYALTHGYLPCPTTEGNPKATTYGAEDARDAAGRCPTLGADGFLPWKTLGLTEPHDAWGSPRQDAASPWLGYFRYRVAPEFSSSAAPIRLSTEQSSSAFLRVRDEIDSADLTDVKGRPPQAPVAIVYSTGPDRIPNGRNADYDLIYQGGTRTEKFDDMTVWIGRPALLAKLVSAGLAY
ncbi:MAG: prepilin-type N-terminal cleavage/methylation domain-containing protein [Gammaproteobacteria bacterium]